jgi:hypothetical protein
MRGVNPRSTTSVSLVERLLPDFVTWVPDGEPGRSGIRLEELVRLAQSLGIRVLRTESASS